MIDCLLHVAPAGCATVDISVDSTDAMSSLSVVYLRVRLFVFSIFVVSVCVSVCCSFQYVIIYCCWIIIFSTLFTVTMSDQTPPTSYSEADLKDLKGRMKLIADADPNQYHNELSLRRYLRAFKSTDAAFQVLLYTNFRHEYLSLQLEMIINTVF